MRTLLAVRAPLVFLPSLLAASAVVLAAAELTHEASRAYDGYLRGARDAFVARASGADAPLDAGVRAALRNGSVLGRPGHGDGITSVPNALVHHWLGAVFIERVSLAQVLQVSQAYADYPDIFEPVVAARVLARTGDTFQLLTRVREAAGGLSATLEVRSTVHYTRVDDRRAYAVSVSEEIREVRNPGRPGETWLPAGQDSGYLWRAATFTRFVEAEGGVYMEVETVGLSRRFPPMLGWLIEPIARRIGRKSVAESADRFRAAVRARVESGDPDP